MPSHQHEMRVSHIKSSGEEVWVCPGCGRRLLVTWPEDLGQHDVVAFDEGDDVLVTTGAPQGVQPVFKLVENAGNHRVVHYFSRPGRPIRPPRQAAPGGTPLSDEMRAWLSEAGFERWWTSKAA